MTLIDRIKDRYGWMRGQYPTSINDIVQREPALAEPLEKVREARVREVATRASIFPAAATVAIPAYGVSLLIASMVASVYANVKADRAVHQAESKFTTAGQDSAAYHGDLKHLDRSIAMVNLEERAMVVHNSINTVAYAGLLGWIGIDGIEAAYQGRFGEAAVRAVTVLSLGGIELLRQRHGVKKLQDKKADLQSRISSLESIALRYAKNITPPKANADPASVENLPPTAAHPSNQE